MSFCEKDRHDRAVEDESYAAGKRTSVEWESEEDKGYKVQQLSTKARKIIGIDRRVRRSKGQLTMSDKAGSIVGNGIQRVNGSRPSTKNLGVLPSGFRK